MLKDRLTEAFPGCRLSRDEAHCYILRGPSVFASEECSPARWIASAQSVRIQVYFGPSEVPSHTIPISPKVRIRRGRVGAQ